MGGSWGAPGGGACWTHGGALVEPNGDPWEPLDHLGASQVATVDVFFLPSSGLPRSRWEGTFFPRNPVFLRVHAQSAIRFSKFEGIW